MSLNYGFKMFKLFFEAICFQNAKQAFPQNTNAKIKIFVKKSHIKKMKKVMFK